MDEHAKSVMREPARVAFSVLAHFQLLFVVCPIVPKQKKCFFTIRTFKGFSSIYPQKHGCFQEKKQHRR
jgi:hypothetical protein